MLIKKGFRFRLYPTLAQEAFFRQFAGARRWVYNRGLAQRTEAWEKEHRRISLYDQNKELTLLKKQEETAWLADVHSQVSQQALQDLDSGFEHFFRRVRNGEKPGYPRFKCKGERDSFRYPQGVKVEADRAWFPKIGWVRFRKSRDIEGVIKQTTIVFEAGHWYVCFACEREQEVTAVSPQRIAGIDVGLENFVTVADGHEIRDVANPRFLRKKLARVRHLSRQLSKKEAKSKNRYKAKAKLGRFWAKLRNCRQDYLHKLSTGIVKNHDAIVVESLKVQQLLQQGIRRALARSISDACWRQLLQFLKYKCAYAGKRFLEAGEYFPSTKQCSGCGKKNPIDLGTRHYSCSCGLSMHRDHNAALNLRAVGTTVLKACGAAP